MCGRYALTTPPQVLAVLFQLWEQARPLLVRYNVAPTQEAPVVLQDAAGRRSTVTMRWGLVPFWAKDLSIGNRLINGRCETVTEKPAFREAFKRRRCIVPATGFYEWQKLPAGRKQPFFIHRADDQPLAFGGVWESWRDPTTGNDVRTFTILTTPACEQLKSLHDRMPLILEPEDFARWLDSSMQDASALRDLLKPAADGVLNMHPVSSRVNSPKNDDSALVQRVEPKPDVRDEPIEDAGSLFQGME